MENQHKETLSALADNEIDDLEWRRLRGVSSDEICALWRRYNHLSEAIRGVKSVPVDVTAGVSSAIAQLDGTVSDSFVESVADGQSESNRLVVKSSGGGEKADAKLSNVDLPQKNNVTRTAWMTIATAASFAFAGIMLIQLWLTDQASEVTETVASSNDLSSKGSILSVAAEGKLQALLQKTPASSRQRDVGEASESQVAMEVFAQGPDLLAKSSSALQRNQLNDYLLRHAGSGFLGTPQGVAPYARLASFSSSNRLVVSE